MGKIENGRFRAYDGIFLNTSAVVIEYHDIIKAPWYSLLQVARMSKSMFILEKMKPLIHTSNEELFEWYVNREHRNFLEDLFPSYVTKEQALDTLNDLMKDPAPWFLPSMLNFGETLKLLYDSKIVKSNDIYVYAEYDNEYMKEDFYNYFDKSIKFVTGEFKDLVTKVPIDTTYVLSDIHKIYDIRDCNHLDYSSILIPHEFQYNKKPNGEFIIDIESEFSHNVFKYNTFINCYK